MTTDPLPWWQTGVIYQIYPRSFKDSNGDGIGDLGGVLEKLDYLSDTLGVDAIWLSPFYPSPMADFGYDVADYTDVDPIFGDLATFDALVAEAHRRGLRVIIDIVPNHTSDRHPWFIASRSSRDNPKRDWYVWRDPAPDGGPPNNWLSVFGGPAWEYDETTGQYYLHSFLKEQPDLNWRNPEVRRAMFDVFRFWLERGVDGFRIDVAHYIMKDPLFRDNPPNPHRGDYHKDMGEYDTQLHLYDKGHEDVHEVFRELRRLLDDYSRDRPRFAVGEIHIFDWNAWVRYYGDNLDELHMPFNFALL
ncbi:MAG: alpha-amylase, partial [Bacteroidetes bacterium]